MLYPMFDAWATLCAVTPFSWDFGLAGQGDGRDWRSAPEQGRLARPGLISERITLDAGTLDYKLYVPSSYSGQACGLVIMLHGCGQDAQDFACGTGMNELAERFQCLVAYPEQPASANSGKCWNWFEDAHHHRGGGEPALIAGVARQIIDEYGVDRNRVFVAGLSAGGAMAVVLGRTHPDLFAAVGCHSGLAYGCAVGTSEAMRAMQHGDCAGAMLGEPAALPMIVFHGDMDGTVHPRNGLGVIEQTIHLHGLGQASGAQRETGSATGRAFTREIHRGAAGTILAERWTVHGSGHAWSGGRRQGSYTDASGPDASSEMMRFFMASSAARAVCHN